MADEFSEFQPGLESPMENGFSITPHDTNDLDYTTRGLYVGVSGHVKVDLAGGDTVTLNSMAAGVVHLLRVTRVYSTGTAATGIVGLY